MSETWTKGTGL